MAYNELHDQETIRHKEKVDRNIEFNQALNLQEKQRELAQESHNSFVARVVNVVYFLFSALEVLLAVRVVLYLLGANPASGFAKFIYQVSKPFVALFANLVQNPTFGTSGVLEVTTLIAMLVYSLAAWLICWLLWLTLSRPR